MRLGFLLLTSLVLTSVIAGVTLSLGGGGSVTESDSDSSTGSLVRHRFLFGCDCTGRLIAAPLFRDSAGAVCHLFVVVIDAWPNSPDLMRSLFEVSVA